MKRGSSALNRKFVYSSVFLFAVMVFGFSNTALAQEILPATTEDLQEFDNNIADIVANQGNRPGQSEGAETFGLDVSGAARQLKDADEETRNNFGESVRNNENFPGNGEDDDGDSVFGQEVSEAAQDLKNQDLETKTNFGNFVRNKENFPGNPANQMLENPAGMGPDQARQMVPSQGNRGPGNAPINLPPQVP